MVLEEEERKKERTRRERRRKGEEGRTQRRGVDMVGMVARQCDSMLLH